MDQQEYKYGIKVLTPENWLTPDMPAVASAGFSPGFDREAWRVHVLELAKVALSDRVPDEIQKFFAVAKGIMCYGVFYYPLFAVAEDRLYLTIESAVRARYVSAGGPKKRPRFEDASNWLCKNGYIDRESCIHLGLFRRSRNLAAHAEFQTIVPSGPPMRFVRYCCKLINELFTDQDETVRAIRAGQPEHHHKQLPI